MKKCYWSMIALACSGIICLFIYLANLGNSAEDNIKPSKLPEDIFYTEKPKEEQHNLEEEQKYRDIWEAEHVLEIGFGYNEHVTQDDINHIGKLIHLKRLNISIGESELDLSPLGNLVELESLNIDILWGCSPDLAFVEKLNKLEKLDIMAGNGVDLSPLGSLSKLRQFSMQPFGGDVDDLSFLKKLNNLEEITFTKCTAIEDLSLFQDMPKLRELWLEYVDDCDLNYLADLKKLESITIAGGNIRNPEGLSNLTHLESLSLDENNWYARYGNTEREPFDLQAIANLKKLEWLYFNYINIEDISPLAELKRLRELSLENTNVRDISPLTSLDNLDRLYISGNNSELVKEQAETLFHEIKYMIVTE